MKNAEENLEFHANSLRKCFPNGECVLSDNILTWTGELTPASMARTYLIELKYKPFIFPEVRILSTGLTIPCIKSDIHMFNDGRLCLHFDDWNPKMSLAKSVIPWTCEWLLFYEFWLVTHKWCGGGTH